MFQTRNRGFTLLEVMLAVAVLVLVGLGIYRFVEAALTAERVSMVNEREGARVEGFVAYLREQMQKTCGEIHGEPHRFQNVSSDELSWIARPGSGLLTRHAAGEWVVTITARPIANGEYELGMRRQDAERKRDAQWLPLLRGVRGFEVRYFDPLRREWMEKWIEIGMRPALVRIKLWRDPEPEPYEVVLPVPAKGRTGGGST